MQIYHIKSNKRKFYKTLKIAVNTRLLLKDKLEGIGWFAYETLKRITKGHPEHQFYFIFDRKYNKEFLFSDNITPVVIPPQARHPFLYYLWFEYSIPIVLKKIKADLFLSPDGYLSLSTNVKSIAVFHDLNFEHYPKDLPLLVRKYYRFYFPKFAKKATRIATVSEYSKKDIINQYGISEDKIDVVYNGANENFKKITESEKKLTLEKITGGKQYFIFIGSLHPRKNLVNLFKAFDLFKISYSSDIQLLIAGEKKWWTNEIQHAYEQMKFKNEVIFSGRLSVEDLYKTIGSALALTYVSYFEGFGIPIVEAFYCDTPVITSNVTSMPEVAGDAALLVDPFSVNSICDAMKQIAFNENLRKDLITKGRIRKKNFNWQKSADRLWNCIEKTLN
ncbi:MAG: glycosyltransferase family 4 protein [Bacteroidales bacterium]|nr:glycosyltransferase family 4 protein [Bacteroidales bacterium]